MYVLLFMLCVNYTLVLKPLEYLTVGAKILQECVHTCRYTDTD